MKGSFPSLETIYASRGHENLDEVMIRGEGRRLRRKKEGTERWSSGSRDEAITIGAREFVKMVATSSPS